MLRNNNDILTREPIFDVFLQKFMSFKSLFFSYLRNENY